MTLPFFVHVSTLWLLDPSVCTLYRMEVLRDPQSKNHPLFKVANDGEKVSCIMCGKMILNSLVYAACSFLCIC